MMIQGDGPISLSCGPEYKKGEIIRGAQNRDNKVVAQRYNYFNQMIHMFFFPV